MTAPSKSFRMQVVTPDRIVFDREVVSVRFPAVDGYTGILANHAPMVSAVANGILSARDREGEVTEMFVADGFARVEDNLLKILSEAGEEAGEIDRERALRAEEEARRLLAERYKVDVDLPRAEAALQRALFRRRLSERRRQG